MLVCICIYTHIWWYMLSWHHQDCPCSNDFIPFFFIGDYSVYSPPQRWLHFTCETSLEIRTEITNGICVCVCVCVCVCNLYMLTRPRTPPAQRLPRSMYVCICIYIHIFICSIYLSMNMTRPRIPQHNGCLEGRRERLGPQGWRWRLCRWVE
jgi:hypothetical protein